MAKSLELRIVSDEVELPEQEMFLKILVVDDGKGHLSSQPINNEDCLEDADNFNCVKSMSF